MSDQEKHAAESSIPASKSAKSATPRVARGSLPRRVVIILLFLAGALAGRFVCAPTPVPDAPSGESLLTDVTETIWTCSMHPQIRLPDPGQCPICSMDLIPAASSDNEGLGPRALSMSENAAALAEIATQPVTRRAVSREVRMVGKVSFDETRLSYITAWVPSRLDRLFVDYTGISVRKGDHMAEVYSPDLIATQQELIQAIKTERLLGESAAVEMQARQAAALQSARDRLRLWGLEPAQIDDIIRRGEPLEHITINSPETGVVIHKNALQGETVSTGTRLFTIADLSKLWIQLDAFESDLAWLHYGQRVEFVTPAWPGETFGGRISFIDPVLNDMTRTVKVRLNVDNSDGRLKPEMFVRATVLAPISAAGMLVDPDLTDMWMCPMHPEVVAEQAGDCQVCGMDLVPTAELGFRAVTTEELPLVIPLTAPLVTGKRAVVYVRVPGTDRPTFEGREIDLGPRVTDGYVVDEGLAEGELVVVKGGFKIDSELQLQAKPSMMSPEGGAPPPGHHHGGAPAAPANGMPAGMQHEGHTQEKISLGAIPESFREQLGGVVTAYVSAQRALADDDPGAARAAARDVSNALRQVDMSALEGPAHMAWMPLAERLSKASNRLASSGDLDQLRPAFGDMSDALIEALDDFGYSGASEDVSVFHCPMALDGGADWLQPGLETINPYYGASMLGCGDRVRDLDDGR